MSRLSVLLGFALAAAVPLLGAPGPAPAQDATPEEGAEATSSDTSGAAAAADSEAPPGWDGEIQGRIAGSQTGYRNWQEGGANTLSFTTELRGRAERATEDWGQNQSFRFLFGQEKQDGRGLRKSADQIRYSFSLQYQGQNSFDPTVAGEFRTQFAPGFNYNENPFPGGGSTPVKVSDLFSPGYVTQSLGLTYDPADWYSVRLGVAGKETVVLIDRLRSLYMEGGRQSVRVQVGADLQIQVDRELMEDVMLESQLTMFAAFNKSDLPDMRWENRLLMEVNDWINVDIEAVALYDSDVVRAVQFRESLSLGLQYTFL